MAEGTPENPHTYPQGVPCWIENQATDVDAAIAFYGELLGWDCTDRLPADAPERFVLATLRGKDVASIATADGTARWVTYIAVDDADAMTRAAEAAGATVSEPPQDAGPAGRWSGLVDPRGAAFRLWQAGRRLGSQVNNAASAWNFSDLLTVDPASDLDFYRRVFDWEVEDMGSDAEAMIRVPGYGDHLEASVDPGIRTRQAGAPAGFADAIGAARTVDDGRSPEWHVTITVEDRDAAADAVTRLGGEVLGTREGTWSWTALVRDPGGATLTLSQPQLPESMR